MKGAAELVVAEERAMRAFPLRRFTKFAHIERYVEDLVSRPWWSSRFPDAPLEITLMRRSGTATYSAAGRPVTRHSVDGTAVDDPGFVWLVDGRGWGLETVLHELAHLAAGPAVGHGPCFRATLAELWRHEAGIEAWVALRDGFERAGLSACDHRAAGPHGGSPRPRPHL